MDNIIHGRLKSIRDTQVPILIDQCDAGRMINAITRCRCPFDDLAEDAIFIPRLLQISLTSAQADEVRRPAWRVWVASLRFAGRVGYGLEWGDRRPGT